MGTLLHEEETQKTTMHLPYTNYIKGIKALKTMCSETILQSKKLSSSSAAAITMNSKNDGGGDDIRTSHKRSLSPSTSTKWTNEDMNSMTANHHHRRPQRRRKSSMKSKSSVCTAIDARDNDTTTSSSSSISISSSGSTVHSKTVRFSSVVQVRPIKHVADMTKKEKRNTWLQRDEVAAILKRARLIVCVVERYGPRVDHKGRTLCTRGLEWQIDAVGNCERVRKVLLAKNAVLHKQQQLRMQERQRQEHLLDCGSDDCQCYSCYTENDGETAIADAYSFVTNQFQRDAEATALRDRKEVSGNEY